jgi:hypothetical protein
MKIFKGFAITQSDARYRAVLQLDRENPLAVVCGPAAPEAGCNSNLFRSSISVTIYS